MPRGPLIFFENAMSMHPRVLLLPLALAAGLSACTSPPSTTGTDPTPAPAGNAPESTTAQPSLASHHWQLNDARDRHGRRIDSLFARSDKPLQLDFGDGRISISNACNLINGGYTLQGKTLTVGQMASTMMACSDPAVAALDSAISSRIEGPLMLEVKSGASPQLILANAGGDRLAFTGVPTATTRYGSAPERVFLEVGPETRPCNHPLIANKQCLQVRQIHYSDAGLKSAPGPWENFYDDIEGYTHQPGMRNVLRLERYTRKDVPADASRYAWVLDMVVESEQVKP